MEEMGGLISLGISLGIIIVIFLLVRLFGAWMLRINDVIDELKKINAKLNKMDKESKN